MGRRKIKMEIAKDAASRLVTFSKSRNGLFKKANELAILCGAELAIVMFSPGGKPFSFGHPSVDAVTQRFLWHLQDEDDGDEHEEAKSPAGGTSSSSDSKKSRRKAEKLNKRFLNLTEELEEEKKRGRFWTRRSRRRSRSKGFGLGLKRSLKKVREEVKLRKREMEVSDVEISTADFEV